MTFNIYDISLLASSYGDQLTHNRALLPTVVAESLDDHATLTQIIQEFRENWEFNGTDSEAAIRDAVQRFNQTLADEGISFPAQSSNWIPIIDKNGNVIGHTIIEFLYRSNAPISGRYEVGGRRLYLTGAACLSIVKV